MNECINQCIEKTHCLLWKSGPEVEVVARVVDVGVARVQCLVLLLLRHLLDRQEPVLPHLDSLGHVAHARVFCTNKVSGLTEVVIGYWLLLVEWCWSIKHGTRVVSFKEDASTDGYVHMGHIAYRFDIT